MLWSKQAAVSEVAQALVQLTATSRKSPFYSTEESGWGLIFTLWSRLRQQLRGWSSPTLPEHAALQIVSHGQWPPLVTTCHVATRQPLQRRGDRRLGVHLSLAEVTSH